MIIDNYANHFAHHLTRRGSVELDWLLMSRFDASVDLNAHQIEVALSALQSPLSEVAVLADEVGLGKTIEAGIDLCRSKAERKRRQRVCIRLRDIAWRVFNCSSREAI